jgi:hypothetical protein
MNFINRITFLDFFGVLSPGVLLLTSVILLTTAVAKLLHVDLNAFKVVNSELKDWSFLIGMVCFFISYLFGSVIRLFANDFSEILSGFYHRNLKRKTDKIYMERFPYSFAAKSFNDSNPEIFEWYQNKYQYFGRENELSAWDKKYFFNKCKANLYAISPERAFFYEKVESFVRFLAGSLFASVIFLLVTFPFGIYFLISGSMCFASVYLSLSITIFLIIIGILERFRHQHTREVMAMWTSYYDALNPPSTESKDK